MMRISRTQMLPPPSPHLWVAVDLGDPDCPGRPDLDLYLVPFAKLASFNPADPTPVLPQGIASGYPLAGVATRDDAYKNMVPGTMVSLFSFSRPSFAWHHVIDDPAVSL